MTEYYYFFQKESNGHDLEAVIVRAKLQINMPKLRKILILTRSRARDIIFPIETKDHVDAPKNFLYLLPIL